MEQTETFKGEDCIGLHTIDIRGDLIDIFRDVPLTASNSVEIAHQLLGKPINDGNGIFIGKILGIDFRKGEWYGQIVIEDSLRELIVESYMNSMSMELKHK